MESSLTLDDMINNPHLLLSVVNMVFASDTRQQYNTPQTTNSMNVTSAHSTYKTKQQAETQAN